MKESKERYYLFNKQQVLIMEVDHENKKAQERRYQYTGELEVRDFDYDVAMFAIHATKAEKMDV